MSIGRHLSESDLLDIAEGTLSEVSRPHVTSCPRCAQSLADLRALLAITTEAGSDDVPEPSPMFWDHLAARVRDAVAEEAAPRAAWAWWRSGWTAGVCACVVIVLAVFLAPRPPVSAPPVPSVVAAVGDEVVRQADDDPTWGLMADLAAELDWDAAAEAGLTGATSLDQAIGELDAEERRELERLVRAELGRPGA